MKSLTIKKVKNGYMVSPTIEDSAAMRHMPALAEDSSVFETFGGMVKHLAGEFDEIGYPKPSQPIYGIPRGAIKGSPPFGEELGEGQGAISSEEADSLAGINNKESELQWDDSALDEEEVPETGPENQS